MSATPAREYVVAALRRLGILDAYDAAKFRWVISKARAANEEFAQDHPDFALPSLALCYDAYAHVSYPDYYESGRRHAEFFAGLIRRHAPAACAVLEWGCGPAQR